MALSQTLLDSLLAFEQPVHRLVQVVLVVVADPELLGQGRAMPQPGGGELRGGMQQPFEHHRQHPVAFAAALRGDQPLQSQAPANGEQRFDMTVRSGTLDREGVLGGDESAALEHLAQCLDFLRGPVGEVGQRFLAHPFALAPALAKEDRGAGVAVRDGLNVHGNINHLPPGISSVYVNDLPSI